VLHFCAPRRKTCGIAILLMQKRSMPAAGKAWPAELPMMLDVEPNELLVAASWPEETVAS